MAMEIKTIDKQKIKIMKNIFTLVLLLLSTIAYSQITYLGSIGNNTYYVSDTTMSWTSANTLCANSCGNMVAINSQQESDSLNILLGNILNPPFGPNAHWLGLIDGNINWGNGDLLTFTNYDVSYTQAPGQYMYIQTNGKWDNSPNDGSQVTAGIYAIIEISSVLAQNDTTICLGDSIPLSVVNGDTTNTCALPLNLQNGLVAYYPFCGNANDESGNGNNGAVNGAALSTDRLGNANSSYYFDGNSTINISNHPGINVSTTGEISISLWARSTSLQAVAHILGKRPSTVPTIEYQISYFTGNYGIGYGSWGDSYIPFPQNDWTHLVMAYNGVDWILYINGIQMHSYSFAPPSANLVDLLIGGSGTEIKFIGDIDDVGVWNRALSPAEVQQLFNSATNSNNLLWSTGDTTTSITVSPNQTTTYWVTQNSCTDSVTVTVLPTTSDTSYITVCDSIVWNGTTYDSSGTYSYNSGGSNNYSMSFDGVDDVVDMGNNSALEILSDITVSMDIMMDGLQPNWQHVLNYGAAGENYIDNMIYLIEIPQNSMTINYLHEYGSGTNVAVPSNYIFNPNQWYNLVVTRDAINMIIEFYIDGFLVQTSSYSTAPDGGSNGHFSIGNQYNLTNDFFKGGLDNVHIWNTALSQSEIQQYMNCPPLGNEQDLVGYWNFEEGSGNTVLDLTLNANNGIINSATYDTNVPAQSCGLTNVNGCDSTAVLNLTISGNSVATISHNGTDLEVTISATYYWNTSETTQTITPTFYGWYWCIVTDVNGCISDTAFYELTNTHTSIIETTNTDRKLLKITNMLGQETPYRRNTPLFYIYDDGTVEKRIVVVE